MNTTTLRRPRRALVVAACAGVLTLVAANTAVAGPSSANNNTSAKLRNAVSAAGISEHLQVLDAIGAANGGTRVSGSPGFDLSADYAEQVFRDAGFSVSTQVFTFQTFIQLSPSVLEIVSPTPGPVVNNIMSYSGSGDVTAAVSTLTVVTGCAASDFAGFPAGNIALIRRGGCTFAAKATNADNAGASGVIIYNNVAGAINGTLGAAFSLDIGVTSVTQAVGLQLAAVAGLVMRLKTDTFRGQASTRNIFAESATGDPDNVVMVGAHLDSVNAGPGINDNGSGSATILEIAEQMAKVKPTNKVRFALWGAEESGLVGSNLYVDSLTVAERQKIALYLNFDMISSPNYVRFVYDGNNSAFPVGPGAAAGPPGSGAIEQLFHDYFAGVSLPSSETAFSGRSDYGRFIFYGIPAGGLFTGAEGIKTAAEAAVFGGTAGVAYDPCYHQACDTFTNVNQVGLEEMADAVAHATLTFAFDTRSVNGSGKGHPVRPPGQQQTGVPVTAAASGGLHDGHELDES